MWGQTEDTSPYNLTNQVAQAFRIDAPPTVDGLLDEPAWRTQPSATNFTQSRPTPQSAPTHRTEVWIAYDDQNIYIAAQMHDPAPDSILQQLSVRDRVENSDEFGIWFSPYNDGINAVGFSTTPRGALNDFIMNAQGSDDAWNGVWEVQSQIHSGGWSTEIRVPWSQFRMPTLPEGVSQTWGMNIWRSVRRSREETVWNALDPTQNGMVNQGGVLRGIQGVDTPPRIALFPYLSAYAQTGLDETRCTPVGRHVQRRTRRQAGLGRCVHAGHDLGARFWPSCRRQPRPEPQPVRGEVRGKPPVLFGRHRPLQQRWAVLQPAGGPRGATHQRVEIQRQNLLQHGAWRVPGLRTRHHWRQRRIDVVQRDGGRPKPPQQRLHHRPQHGHSPQRRRPRRLRARGGLLLPQRRQQLGTQRQRRAQHHGARRHRQPRRRPPLGGEPRQNVGPIQRHGGPLPRVGILQPQRLGLPRGPQRSRDMGGFGVRHLQAFWGVQPDVVEPEHQREPPLRPPRLQQLDLGGGMGSRHQDVLVQQIGI